MSQTTENLEGTAHQLRDQAKTIADDVREFGAIGKELAREGVSTAAERARSAKDDAVERAHDYEDALVEYVRKQPLKSMLIAAGAGALAAMWLRR